MYKKFMELDKATKASLKQKVNEIKQQGRYQKGNEFKEENNMGENNSMVQDFGAFNIDGNKVRFLIDGISKGSYSLDDYDYEEGTTWCYYDMDKNKWLSKDEWENKYV